MNLPSVGHRRLRRQGKRPKRARANMRGPRAGIRTGNGRHHGVGTTRARGKAGAAERLVRRRGRGAKLNEGNKAPEQHRPGTSSTDIRRRYTQHRPYGVVRREQRFDSKRHMIRRLHEYAAQECNWEFKASTSSGIVSKVMIKRVTSATTISLAAEIMIRNSKHGT